MQSHTFSSNKDKEASDSAITKLLHHIAYDELDPAKTMIEEDPALLLQTGNVVTRSGPIVKDVRPLEFAIGAEKYEMASMMCPYFEKIQNGEAYRTAQFKKYEQAIDGMNKDLDQAEKKKLEDLLEIIKKSSDQEVTDALNEKMDPESKIAVALRNFREHMRPKEITQPSIHYNYKYLSYIVNLLIREWNNLSDDKIKLARQKLIDFEFSKQRLDDLKRAPVGQNGLGRFSNTGSDYASFARHRSKQESLANREASKNVGLARLMSNLSNNNLHVEELIQPQTHQMKVRR